MMPMTKPLCSVEGCNRTSYCRTWCQRHYMRWYYHGDPGIAEIQRSRPYFLSLEESLRWYGWEVTESDCWEWAGRRSDYNYGVMNWQDRERAAHRLSYEAFVGSIPDGLHILHSCDNPPCVNPAHLRVGTHADNMQDKVERARQYRPRGGLSPRAKLDETKVREIRRRRTAGENAKELAVAFEVSVPLVYKVARKEVWAWLD